MGSGAAWGSRSEPGPLRAALWSEGGAQRRGAGRAEAWWERERFSAHPDPRPALSSALAACPPPGTKTIRAPASRSWSVTPTPGGARLAQAEMGPPVHSTPRRTPSWGLGGAAAPKDCSPGLPSQRAWPGEGWTPQLQREGWLLTDGEAGPGCGEQCLPDKACSPRLPGRSMSSAPPPSTSLDPQPPMGHLPSGASSEWLPILPAGVGGYRPCVCVGGGGSQTALVSLLSGPGCWE